MGASAGFEPRDLLWAVSADVELVATNLIALNGLEATLGWLNAEHLEAVANNDQVTAAGAMIVRDAVLRITSRQPGASAH